MSTYTPHAGRLQSRPFGRSLAVASALSLLMAATASAQTSPAAPAPAEQEDGEVVQLTPFEVRSDQDTGYAATETLAGTRIRTDLRDVGGAISVVTKEMLRDIGATDNNSLLQYTPNAEVAGVRGSYTGLGNGTDVNETPQLRAPGGAQRVRGLASADNTRDFFVTDIPWDSFNVDRIDIQRGPNSILFGLGSPAGIVNAQTRSAEFRNLGNVEARFGSYASWRTSIDINQELIDNVLAIRFDGLWNDEKFKQDPAFQQDKRFYGAVRFDPQLFNRRDFHTSIRAKYEHGEIDANRPRITPPNDSITPWFRAVDRTSLNGGAGKASVNNGYEVGASVTTFNPWFISDSIANQQQPIWFMDGTTNQLYRIYGGFVSTGPRNPDGTILSNTSNLVGQRYSSQFYGLTNLASYASNVRLAGSEYGQYRTASLLDPTVFDFYNKLIDGTTKSEFENWNAYNVSLQQTGWDDRVGVEFNYDRQKYKRGGEGLLVNQPTINIDVLRNFQDLNANTNFGRPYVSTTAGGGNSYESERKYIRGSLFGELRAKDFFHEDSFLAKLLGKHRFNGVYSNEKYATETRSWRQYLNSQAWDAYWTRAAVPSELRPPVGVIYLGSSLANASSAANSHIPNITAPVTLPDGNVYHFASTWTNFGTAFNAPWTIPSSVLPMFNPDSTPAPNTQASNPANYVGWNSNFPISLRRYNGGDDESLLTAALKSQRETTSYATSWQGFLWKDAIVPTLGWRYDEVKTKRVVAPPGAYYTVNMQPDVYKLPDQYPANETYKDHSTSGGVVVHLNRLLPKDPLPLNVSLSYSKSNNFQIVDSRRDIYGKPIGNPTGSTKDYGIMLSTKDGKYSLRALKYETSVANSSTTLNARGLTDIIAQGLNWRNILLYRMEAYKWDTGRDRNIYATNVNVRHDWLPAYVNSAGRAVAPASSTNPPAGSTLQTAEQAVAMRDAAIRSWNDIQKWLDAKGYFSAWGFGAGPTTISALTDRATLEANLPKDANGQIIPDSTPAGAFAPNPASVYDYRTAPKPDQQGFAVTADTKSEGYEFEFTANPTRNWRIAINASQTEAVRTNFGGPELTELVDYLTQQIAGPAGNVRMFNARFDDPNNVIWNNGGSPTSWLGFRGQWMLFKLNEGSAASELRKWRYNVVTNYTFDEGFLKGVNVGGSYRWQDKVVIGYPVVAKDANNFSFDLSKPYYGPSEDAVDFWVGYERKLTKRIHWKIQLNVRNAFAKEELIPISVQPDGKTWASARIAPDREWFVTNTFSF